jgi:hypothetical protein
MIHLKMETVSSLRNIMFLNKRRTMAEVQNCDRYATRKMRWAGHVARMGENMNAYRLLVGKPEGKRPPGIPRLRWVENIRMFL